MTIKTLQDVKDLGFTIEEVVNNVTEYSNVDLNEWTTLQGILNYEHTVSSTRNSYDAGFVRYQVIKDKTVITELLDRNELVSFFEQGEYKKHLHAETAGEMELTKDEMIFIDSFRNPEKYKDVEKDYLTGPETTLLEDFIEMKKKNK